MKKKILILLLIPILILSITGCNKKEVKEKEKPMKKEETKVDKNNYVSYNGKLKIKGVDLVNQYDEKILLQGISTHGVHWFKELYTKDNIKKLKDEFNINVFRIAMYTDEGGYISDKSIKNKVEELIEYCKELDLYVIIDWHILHDNNPNIHKEEAKKFFEEMSNKYKDYDNIIFEICNEPNGNTTWDEVKSYAEEVIPIIRKNTNNIIIVGTPTWSQEVDKAADNPLKFDNITYALHFYSGTHKEELRNKIDYARDKGISIFVSEFGISDASGNGGVFLDEGKTWLNYLRSKNISYVNWSLANKDESSALLLPNTNTPDDNNLSASGKFIKEQYNKGE